jgi:sulfur-oxidizing protein SoxY
MMMDRSKRKFVRDTGVLGVLLGLSDVGFISLATGKDWSWHNHAFEADNLSAAIRGLTGQSVTKDASGLIQFIAPPIAENGAVVPVGVKVDEGIRVHALALLCEKNPRPLAAYYELSPQAVPFIRTRIKMAETASVIALIRTDAGFISAETLIKVTRGGCGG